MARRHAAQKREITPDPKYKDPVIAKFINALMLQGKKSVAEKILYSALESVANKGMGEPLEMFHAAVDNIRPFVEVRSRRVGGATYQVPMDVSPSRSQALAIRWIIGSARSRNESNMEQRLCNELIDASQKRGAAYKKREDTHRTAEGNRAFAHYRW